MAAALHCTALYCTVLYCTAMHCTVTVLCCQCSVLSLCCRCTALYCTILFLYCTVLYSTIMHCTASVLRHLQADHVILILGRLQVDAAQGRGERGLAQDILHLQYSLVYIQTIFE